MSRLVVAAVGLACKVALGSGFCSVTVRGLPVLRNALESAARDQGQGVLTGVFCFASPLSHKHKND